MLVSRKKEYEADLEWHNLYILQFEKKIWNLKFYPEERLNIFCHSVWQSSIRYTSLVAVNLETLKCNFWYRQVESAPKVASPVLQYNSPNNVPAVSQNHKPIAPEQLQSEVDGAEVTQKKTFVFEMKTKGHVVSTCIWDFFIPKDSYWSME